MTERRNPWIGLVVFVGISLAFGGIGSIITSDRSDAWYAGIAKPAWTPPDWLFGPVWTTLYILMGIAAWLVWKKVGLRAGAMPLILFGIQLLLNLSWNVVFFSMQSPGAALIEIIVLWLAILATLIAFWRVTPVAGWLFVPYLAWVTYAAALNFEIWRLNT